MRANPGGQLAPDEVIGRDEFVSEVLLVLARQSMVLSAERRMGKTSLFKKIAAEAGADWLPLYRDTESISTPREFTQRVLEDLQPHMGSFDQLKGWFDGLLTRLGGAQIGPVKLPNVPEKEWKPILQEAMTHLSASQGGKRVIFVWDEFPWMLQKMTEGDAMEVLDTLREIRQTRQNLRMVLTGSIGLHHVLRGLKEKRYANAPFNDMKRLDLPPLAADHAASLARALMEGEGLTWEGETTPLKLCAAVDCIPFFIHHVVDHLRVKRINPVTPAAVEQVIVEAFRSDHDNWELKHYFTRIPTYYGEAQVKPILALLDSLAADAGSLPFARLVNQVSGNHPGIDEETWREWLDELMRDHYVRRTEAGDYGFRFPLVQRWWRWHRSLT